MKKLGKISISLGMLMLVANNSYAATSEAGSGNSTKYVFMAIAAVVIILLLFIGYKMDTKGDELDIPKAPKKADKKALGKKEKLEEKYEADNIGYEIDAVKPDDINDAIEYEEDEEDDGIEDSSADFGFSTSNASFGEEKPEEVEEAKIAEPEEVEESEETFGEEFDTSIIDGIEDEDDIEITPPVMDTPAPKSFDETMVFGSTESDKLSEEIDELDNIDENTEMEIGGDLSSDPFLEELNKFKEPETDFEGFSVAAPKDEIQEEPKIEEVKKTTKKYTKTKKEEPVENAENEDVVDDQNFLAQMEKNLEKSKEERNAKKTTRKKKE